MSHKFFLTFDVEDFINVNSIKALKSILNLMEKYDLKGIFFITALMAERLSKFPKIIESLKIHEIGYHSSSHSVRPTIPEYTDVEKYEDAYSISIERETSHINPLTGEVEGRGGIYFLKELFPNNEIRSFRAPGNCWTSPHIEAMRDLGIEFDFSTNISSERIQYKGITFYPYTLTQQWEGSLYEYGLLAYSILKNGITILDLHPWWFVIKKEWDHIYYEGNPKSLIEAEPRDLEETRLLFKRLESLLQRIKLLKFVELSPQLKKPGKYLTPSKNEVEKYYDYSVSWTKRFHFQPKHLRNHFNKYFTVD